MQPLRLIQSNRLLHLLLPGLLATGFTLAPNPPSAWSQTITPAADSTGTAIIPVANSHQIDITGGTLSGDGSNLFHSFSQFGLTPSQIANFLTTPDIHNILGRVTGGDPSVINGIIQISGGNSNLYLMNPAGIIFGPNASLNVLGDFTATTATAIGWGSNEFFNAMGSNNYTNLNGNPNQLAFDLNQSGAIINAGNLAGKNLNLVGGTVVNTGTLSAPNGQITLASVPGTSLIKISQPGSLLSFEIEPLTNAQGQAIPFTLLDLPQLLTQTTIETGLTVNPDNSVTETISGVEVTAGSTTVAGQMRAENVNLLATNRVVPIPGNSPRILTGDGTESAPTVTLFPQAANAPKIFTFIDATVPDYETFLYGGKAGTTSIVVLPRENGIEKITTTLNQVREVDELHILSEGNQGNFWLGNAFVSSNNIGQYSNQIQAWGSSLNAGADILIYACLTALGVTGESLLNSIASLSGADVAGSTNITGNAALGGDWILERSVGDIEATTPFESGVLANYGETLATFTVENTNDSGADSLRDAIAQANTLAGDDEIRFNPGVFNGTQGAIFLTSGQLTIDTTIGKLTISGAFGASDVVIDGNKASRVFNIEGNGNTTFDSLTIQNGNVTGNGSGINNTGTGIVNVINSIISDNTVDGPFSNGGGIFSQGALNLTGSTISNNSAGRDGGGIFSQGAVTISNSTRITNNTATNLGGGIFSHGAVTATNSILSENRGFRGGGVFGAGSVTVTDSEILNNQAEYGGGIVNLGAVTMTGGTIFGNRAGVNGGGMSSAGPITVNNSTISGNQAATGLGGGIESFNNGVVTIINSTISDNTAKTYGGGIYSDGGVISRGSRILNNRANDNGGGGIYSKSLVELINSVISDNSAGFNGGGIRSGGGVTSNNSEVSNNTAKQRGGGIFSGGSVEIIDSKIFSNRAESDGGGILSLSSTVKLMNSTISGNSGDDGGGIHSQGPVMVTNSTISGNDANKNGGGLWIANRATITDSTITNNTADNDGNGTGNGGGIFGSAVGDIIATFSNTIVAGNIDGSGEAPDVGAGGPGSVSFSGNDYNLVGSTAGFSGNLGTGSDIVNPNPGLTPLGNYGGSTQTHALLPGSPALNAGKSKVATDQRGEPRPGGIAGDIGAFESMGFSLIPIAGDGQSAIANMTFGQNLKVQLIDNSTQLPFPFEGLDIAFMLPTSEDGRASGSFNMSNTATTDLSGMATANPLTANKIAGSYQVTALATGLEPVVFNLINTPDVPNSIEIGGGNYQTTLVNTAFANLLSVRVTDRFGNPIPSLRVSFNAPETGASGRLSNSTFTTNADGVVATSVTANGDDGTYQVAAQVDGLPPALFELVNEPLTSPPLPITSLPNPIPPNPINSLDEPGQPNIEYININSVDISGNGAVTPSIPCLNSSFWLCLDNPRTVSPPDIQQLNPDPEIASLVLDTAVAELEERFVSTFENYLGIEATSVATLEQAQEILHKIDVATGSKPALIYAFFFPRTLTPTSEKNLAKMMPSSRACGVLCDPISETFLHSEFPVLSEGLELAALGAKLVPQPSDRLELVLVTASGRPLRYKLDVTREQVLQEIRNLQNTVVNPSRPRAYLAPAQQMYRWLIAPLEEDLKAQNINNLVFILDAGLRSVPLAAMHDETGFVVERYSLGLMPSLSLTDTRYASLQGSTVLAMGANTFTEQNALPAVETELEAIARIGQGKTLLNEEFTLANLQTARSQNIHRIIHLATHGEFRAGKPDNSYIQLWDEQLNLEQLRNLEWYQPPPVELLVLSACRTALGDREAELGFAGLAVIAGVKTAMGSLWSVNDEGTLGLMTMFYEQLQEAPIRAEALRRTQVAMLKGEVRIENGELVTPQRRLPLPPELAELRSRSFSHPYYWSGFTMIGSPW